jgi:hypothetical protein
MANEVFRSDVGTMKDEFHVGGPEGPAVVKDGVGFAAKDAAGVALVNVSVKDAAGDDNCTTLRDVKRIANLLIEFSFDGIAPPAAGVNTGTFGICGKTGGSYNAGEVAYDNGIALVKVNITKGQTLTTAIAVTGSGYTVTLVDNGFYAAESNAAPFSWTMKGDGSPSETGAIRKIKLDIALVTKSSTTALPVGAVIESVETVIETPYSTGANLAIEVDGVTPVTLVGANDTLLQEANTYISEPGVRLKVADEAGVIKATITGAPTEGSGFIVVSYCGTFLA